VGIFVYAYVCLSSDRASWLGDFFTVYFLYDSQPQFYEI